jgi:type 1 glutamine amidotransferase
MEYHHREELVPLLHCDWEGDAAGFAENDWARDEPDRHLVQYLRRLGDGQILYNTLGHCRSHWDMVPLADYYPSTERCSWEKPQYHELLRRGLRWALGADA